MLPSEVPVTSILFYFWGKFTLQKTWLLLFLDNQPFYPVYPVADWFTVDRLGLQWAKVDIYWHKVGHREHRVNMPKSQVAPEFILFLWKVYFPKKGGQPFSIFWPSTLCTLWLTGLQWTDWTY